MSQDFIDSVAAFIEAHELLSPGDRVVVGVSGGVDSMVCLEVLRRLEYDVHAMHVNYGLRSGASRDEALVRDWCRERTPPIPLRVETCDAEGRAEHADESLQEAARHLRYELLAKHARRMEAAAVAVAHHRDDQAETVLLNLVRGAGPEGLAGMSPTRSMQQASEISLIRPLLDVRRRDIEAYAEASGIPWREDPTNRDLSYDRGAVRAEILPLLESHFEGATENVARTARLLREYVDATLTPALEERLDRCYVERDGAAALLVDALRREPSVWRRRLILAALDRVLPEAPKTAAVAREIEALIDAQVGRRVELGGGTVWREREGLFFFPAEQAPEVVSPPVPVPWGEEVSLPGGALRIEPLETVPESLDSETPNVEYADADRLVDPLAVGTWQAGDRIQPLGMEGTKLVSDLLTDLEVPPHRRQGVYVLTTDEHMAWVVGVRLDHRVRVRPSTERVVRLSWDPREKPSDDCNSA